MDIELKEITLPAFLWYILPGLNFVLIVVALPLVLIEPSLLGQLDSIGGAVLALLVALVTGFVMDSLKLYAWGLRHEKKSLGFFQELADALGLEDEREAKVLIDPLRLGLPDRGALGRAVAFNHSRWVMMTHSAKSFFIGAILWLVVTLSLAFRGRTVWYQTELGIEDWAWGLVTNLGIAGALAVTGFLIERHASGQRRVTDNLYLAYAKRHASELRQELRGEVELAATQEPQLPEPKPDLDVETLLAALREVMSLKTVKRKGWQQKGLADAESVADHSFMMGFLAFVLAPRPVPARPVDRGRDRDLPRGPLRSGARRPRACPPGHDLRRRGGGTGPQ